MELTAEELRVLGCLIEKQATTPDQYPLSTNALVNACNQKSNREPLTDYSERTVMDAMLLVRQRGLALMNSSGRTDKRDTNRSKHESGPGDPAEFAADLA